MTRIMKHHVHLISIYLEEQYLEELMEIRIEKFMEERREFKEREGYNSTKH